jgi:hypothetical protein
LSSWIIDIEPRQVAATFTASFFIRHGRQLWGLRWNGILLFPMLFHILATARTKRQKGKGQIFMGLEPLWQSNSIDLTHGIESITSHTG